MIPVIDLAGANASPGALAEAIRAAVTDAGFFYVANHGVGADLVADVFEANRRFHAWPVERKSLLRQNRWHRGYMGFGDTKLSSSASFAPARRANRMESLMVRHELPPDHPDVLAGRPLQGPNQWPDDPGIVAAIQRYDAAVVDLAHRLLPALSVATGEAPGFFAASFRPASTALRLIHYPPSPADRPEDLYGSHPHTDYGFLTILAQDEVGGLEVQATDGGWIPAPPLPGTFVINIGDAFARWTNDAFRSTPHRVINRSNERDRYSVAMFFDPDLDARIECRPQHCLGRPAKYEPVRYGDYYCARLDANYARYDGPPPAR